MCYWIEHGHLEVYSTWHYEVDGGAGIPVEAHGVTQHHLRF